MFSNFKIFLDSFRLASGAALYLFISSLAACSEAKFSALVGSPDVNQNGGNGAIGDLSCSFLHRPHPDTDAMLFDVLVSGSDVTLEGVSPAGSPPVNNGSGHGFYGVALPVTSEGLVTANVSQGGRVASCSEVLFPLQFVASPMMPVNPPAGTRAVAIVSEAVAFKWTWKNLHKDETVVFAPQSSAFSPDLRVTCSVSPGTVLVSYDPPAMSVSALLAGGDKLWQQESNCLVAFDPTSDATLKSVRYKAQKFAWILKRPVAPEQLLDQPIQRVVTIDLIRNSSALPVSAGVVDPETCRTIPDKSGYPFSHICEGPQSVVGGVAVGMAAACRMISADVCP